MMRLAFTDAVLANATHPLVPAIKRALKSKPKQYGGWTTNARGSRQRGKRSR
jgi:hypothetical protein